MKKYKDKDNLSIVDCFLYKLVISLLLLFILCLLDKFKIINTNKTKENINYNINLLQTIVKVNGKLNLIDLGTEEEIKVSNEPLIYEENNKINTSLETGIKNYNCGVCTKIEKDEKYKITILGIDNKEYVYGNIDNLDIHIYSYLKTGDIIGSSSSYYTLDINEKS